MNIKSISYNNINSKRSQLYITFFSYLTNTFIVIVRNLVDF